MNEKVSSNELSELRKRLQEAEEALKAIRNGDVDAIVVPGERGKRVYTLQGADQPYRLLIESINEGALTLTADGAIFYANRQFANMVGLPLDQVIASSLFNYISNDDRDLVARMIRREEAGISRHQVMLKAGEGRETPVHLSLNSEDVAGKRFVTAVVTDLTYHKQMEDTIRQKELQALSQAAELKTLADAMPGIVLIAHDRECRVITGNRTAYEFLRLPKDTNLAPPAPDGGGKRPYRIMRKETEVLYDEMPIQQAAKGRDVRDYEVDVVFDDGTVRTILGNASPVFENGGRPRGAIAVFVDITEHKRAEEKLRESELLFRGYFEQAAVGIAHVSIDGRFIRINQRFCEIVGYGREEMLAMTFQDITYPGDLEADLNHLRQTLEGVIDNYSIEKRYIRKDEHLMWVHLTATLLRDEGGKPSYFVSVIEDITERKRLEEELEKHRRHLEDMVQERTAELESKNIAFQELNAALKVLLKQREDDKKDMEETFVTNIRNLVLPYLDQIKKGHIDITQRTHLDIIEAHLHQIADPLLKNVRQFNLTPRETKVASLVRQGKSTKEIAEILGISGGSIGIHRKNIREKLGLNRSANLQSYLENLEQ